MAGILDKYYKVIYGRGAYGMNKEEFLRQLELLLEDISAEERADAMAFYRSYFEDAGEGNERAVLEELESPKKVAENIKKNDVICRAFRYSF